jgi:hypothetical protein
MQEEKRELAAAAGLQTLERHSKLEDAMRETLRGNE